MDFDERLEDLTSDVYLSVLDAQAFEEASGRVWLADAVVRVQFQVRGPGEAWQDVRLDGDAVTELGHALADLQAAARTQGRPVPGGVAFTFHANGWLERTLLPSGPNAMIA